MCKFRIELNDGDVLLEVSRGLAQTFIEIRSDSERYTMIVWDNGEAKLWRHVTVEREVEPESE